MKERILVLLVSICIGALFFSISSSFSNQAFAVDMIRTDLRNTSGGIPTHALEPTTLLLLGVGLIGFASICRRKPKI